MRRLAIVDRGEAAMRCIRAVKSLREQEELPLLAIALYAAAEREAPFVRHADIAHPLPPRLAPQDAYRDHDALIAALVQVEADAVWPGWGFVAEDPGFADRVRAEGMRFLGPPGEVMRAVGDKIGAKRVAERAGVPVPDWRECPTTDDEEALRRAVALGFPLLVKSAQGGGGRGIRLVRDPSELADAIRRAGDEAARLWGNARLLLERRLSRGRHIEVQLAADEHGQVLSLGCRDCSVQRRYQKVIEEAPPAGLAPGLRGEIEASALRIARQVDYVGLGTAEFLLTDEGFSFLELNPRLQVEHGITEAITGLDLVQLQVRIARGESLAGLSFREQGAAIEARLCAEDPEADFAPAPGRVARFDPCLGLGLRIDSGVVAGGEIPGCFDPLVAKLIASGANRDQARCRLLSALSDFDIVIQGGATNKGHLLEVLRAPEFRRGAVDSEWLERWDRERERGDDLAAEALLAAAVLAYEEVRRSQRTALLSDPRNLSAARLPSPLGEQVDLSHRGESYRLAVLCAGPCRYRICLDQRRHTVEWRADGVHAARIRVRGREHRVLYDCREASLRVEVEGHAHRFERHDVGELRAEIPAVVVGIRVSVGERVEAGASVGLLEAMKTEVELRAPVAGIVTELRAQPGQQVAPGEVLVVVTPELETPELARGRRRLRLPRDADPVADLCAAADAAAARAILYEAARSDAGGALPHLLGEDIRNALLGYDAEPERVAALVRLLELLVPAADPLPPRSPPTGLQRELAVFADVEELFVRAPRAGATGGLQASPQRRLLRYLTRPRAGAEGLDEEFLGALRRALAHYGVMDLVHDEALERALVRMLGTRRAMERRQRLALGLIRQLPVLAKQDCPLGSDAALGEVLSRIAAMRDHVPDALADAALEASYAIFERRHVVERVERLTKGVEEWLAASEEAPVLPPGRVLRELADAPEAALERIAHWHGDPDPRRRTVAQAARLQRFYAASDVQFTSWLPRGDAWIQRLDLADGRTVLGGCAEPRQLVELAETLCDAADQLRSRDGCFEVDALELLLCGAEQSDAEGLTTWLGAALRRKLADQPAWPRRFTLSLLAGAGGCRHQTFVPTAEGPRLVRELHGLHPETAARVGLDRLAAFDLEPLESPPDLYCFEARSREIHDDERVFVLAEARGRAIRRELGRNPALDALRFAFLEATASLRSILSRCDPRRRLHWNRILIAVDPALPLRRHAAEDLLRGLEGAARHLGLEQVVVCCSAVDGVRRGVPALREELLLEPAPDGGCALSWRPACDRPLEPASRYERRVAEARRRGLVHPYEIIRMLTGGGSAGHGRGGPAPLPAGSFEEYDLDPAAARPRALRVADRPFGSNACAVVFGVVSTPTAKVPQGMRRVLILSDPTLAMGSLAAPECERVLAALDLAEAESLPVEWVPVSSGARIAMDSGTENLDATARVARRIVEFTQAGGVIHVIVHGPNVGAQSYFNALAAMLPHTRGAIVITPRGAMVLTGRAALEASGGVAAEDEVAIGGYESTMGANGEADYYARDLADAYRILYEHYRYTYVVPGSSAPARQSSTDPASRNVCEAPYPADPHGFRAVGEIFDEATNPGRKRAFAMRPVMQALIDRDGGSLERWRDMAGAETAIVWDAHLGGIPVCLIGIESQRIARFGRPPADGPASWLGGTLFPLSSKKLARALNAASGNRPVVVLANLSGFDGSPESLRELQLEHGAEIARAVVNFRGPILFAVVSRYHGGAYVVFSRALNAGLRSFALTGSYASVIGGVAAASVVFGREVRARAAADPEVEERREAVRRDPSPEARRAFDESHARALLAKQKELAAEFDAIHDVERARAVGSLEAVVEPAKLRGTLIAMLEQQPAD